MSTQVRPQREAGANGAVVAIAAGVIVFGLIVAGLLALFVRQFAEDSADRVPVVADAVLAPEARGVRVVATVRALRGELPDTITVPREDVEARYLTSSGPQHQAGVEAPVLWARVDGRDVEPGSVVDVAGTTVRLEYAVGPRDDGTRVAYTPTGLGAAQVVEVQVTLEGNPSACLQPEGRRFNQDFTWVRSCAGSPIVARRGPATAPGYSRIDIAAWVRVSYAPAG
ncbi:MAG: hypothetical protein ACRCSN_07200 [Dermatophilaceae bacterium]